MKIDIKGSRVLGDLMESTGRIRVLEGGSRSTKTYSIIQFLILYCQINHGAGKSITISRQRLTWLKATIIPDFKTILQSLGLWNESDWHKSEMTYRLFGNEIWFIGLDEPQKLHGRKQDVFWINEAMEATIDDFDQLEMRTSDFGILDYNPTATEHWIYSRVLTREDVGFNHSTMLDNPFLEDAIRDKILSYEPTQKNILRGTADENKWKIYGEGKRSQIEGAVYTNYNFVKLYPGEIESWIWLDFGFTNDPTAIGRMGLANEELWIQEFCYQTGMTNRDISNRLSTLGISKSQKIIADSAEAKSIKELQDFGWNVIGVTKGADSIRNGIDRLKSYRWNVTEDSLNIKTELSNYVWVKDRNTGKFLNVPIDDFNHHLDGIRYVALECLSTKQSRRKTFGVGARLTN